MRRHFGVCEKVFLLTLVIISLVCILLGVALNLFSAYSSDITDAIQQIAISSILIITIYCLCGILYDLGLNCYNKIKDGRKQ